MKTIYIFGLAFIFLLFIFVLTSANFSQSFAPAQTPQSSFVILRTTPTPDIGGVSEIGSTGGIMLMGVVITIIVTVPLFFHRKKK